MPQGRAWRRLLALRREALDLPGDRVFGGEKTLRLKPGAIWLFATGLATLLGQVVLLRELCVAFYGSELAYLLGLALVMTGTALGALFGQWRPASSAHGPRFLLLLFSLLLPASTAGARLLNILFGGTPGAFLSFGQQLAGAAIVMLPAGFLGGLLFQRSASLYSESGGSLALAYSVESAGSIAGGAASVLLLAAGASNLSTSLACGACSLFAAWLPLRGKRPKLFTVFWACSAVAIVSAFSMSARLDGKLTELSGKRAVLQKETPYGRLLVTRSEGQVTVFLNGALAYESQGTSAEELVHPAALEVANPSSVLLLGGASSGLVAEVLKHHPEKVIDVEIDEAVAKYVAPLLPASSRAALADPRVKIATGDPRRYVSSHGRWDLIICAMPGPESLGANRFYTREFFDICKEHLAGSGVLAFKLQSAENLWTPLMVERAATIHEALASVFTDTLVLPGTANIFLASMSKLQRDPGALKARYEERGIGARLVTPRYAAYLLTNDRRGEIESLLSNVRAEPNSDSRPVCYPLTLLLHLSRLFPRLGMAAIPGPDKIAPWVWGAAILAAALFLLLGRGGAASAVLAAACAGFAGMVLETGLLLGYQSCRGALFMQIGLLMTLFMAGLATGAAAANWIGKRKGWFGAASAASVALVATAVAARARLGVGWNIFSAGAMLLCSGAASGMLFGAAASHRERSGGALYGADLVGGVAGTLLGGAVMLPFLGLAQSALMVAAVALAAIALRIRSKE